MQFKDFSDGSEGSKTFLRLKDGDEIRGVLAGDIHETYKKWIGGKPMECAPDEPGAGLRFKVNIIVDENGGLISKVWEFGVSIYSQLRDIHGEYPLEKTKIKIIRKGSTKDNTEYTILPLLNEKDRLTDKQLEKIKSIDLHKLTKEEKAPIKNYAPGGVNDEDIRF